MLELCQPGRNFGQFVALPSVGCLEALERVIECDLNSQPSPLPWVLIVFLSVFCLVPSSGADYYDYGHGLSDEAYDSYGE